MFEEVFRYYADANNRMIALGLRYVRLLNKGKIKHYYIELEEAAQ